MSKLLGSQLPEDLHRRWAAPERQPGRVVVVHTVDDRGWPHPALLSEFEVLATAPDHLRLACGPGSRTAANLRERRRITLAIIEPEGVYYIKALSVAETSNLYELKVEAVLIDEAREEETDTRLVLGLRFTAGPGARAYFERVLAALRVRSFPPPDQPAVD
ncbi:MAG: pyridoxamine 5'-phosphate oxidase family protein [Acidobacteria bacterium]|nr:pyridoxamine 5'-phosphate oxidase family protein [Acidobacteriota bacterium]